MQDKQNNLDDLLRLESVKHKTFLVNVVDAGNLEVARKIQQLRDRGVGRWGIASREIGDIFIRGVKKIAMKMVECRRETAGKNLVLATAEHLRQLQQYIFTFIDNQQREADHLISRPSGVKAPCSVVPLTQEIARLKSEVQSALLILEIEMKTGLGVVSPPPSNITIQGSSVGNLNLLSLA